MSFMRSKKAITVPHSWIAGVVKAKFSLMSEWIWLVELTTKLTAAVTAAHAVRAFSKSVARTRLKIRQYSMRF